MLLCFAPLCMQPFGFLACMAVSGCLITALVWVTVDLFDDGPPSNGSNPNLT